MSLQAGVQRVQESALRSHSQFVQELRWAPTPSLDQGLGVLPSPLWCHLQGRGTFTLSREDPPGLGQTLGSRLGPCTEARGFQGCHLGLMALGLSGREGPPPSPPHVDVTGFLPSLSLPSLSACFLCLPLKMLKLQGWATVPSLTCIFYIYQETLASVEAVMPWFKRQFHMERPPRLKRPKLPCPTSF